ncbi:MULTISPECIES: hypothetical protein [unclassified Methanosarcina]|uniref:hypothetical protein n=1 Tax=unclassified Methanosarcina TaxID=2644672 RepID=UPI000A9BE82F|nr:MULTISPECIES: hypothetical protein [unclassified Methanosarcina]
MEVENRLKALMQAYLITLNITVAQNQWFMQCLFPLPRTYKHFKLIVHGNG